MQWHSQVGRRLATIRISCILLLLCIFVPLKALQSAFCVCYIIGAAKTLNVIHPDWSFSKTEGGTGICPDGHSLQMSTHNAATTVTKETLPDICQ